MASKSILTLFIFIFLASLPLFLFMFYYERLLEKTLIEVIQILNPNNKPISFPEIQIVSLPFYYPFESQIFWLNSITPKFTKGFMSLWLLHLIPFHLLALLSAISTIHLASRPLTDEEPFTLLEAIKTSWLQKHRLKGAFVTSIIILSLSSCALLGFLWLTLQSYTMGMIYLFDPMFSVAYPIAIVLLLVKFLELSAVWNMSLVISALEGVDGMRAFSLAFYFNRGSERRGLFMMLMFFALGLGLRLPCLFERDGREAGLVARTGLLWVVHLVKWVACTWYYFGCKNRVLKKNADLEVGRKVEDASPKNVP